MSEVKPGVIRPPAIFYEESITNATDQTIAAQKNITYITERIEATPNGIMKYNKGMLFPEKGWPTPEAMWNCNIVKRKLMGTLYILTEKHGIFSIIGFLITPWPWKKKWLNNFLHWFNWECEWILRTIYYKEEIYSPCPKELKKALYLFLYNLGLDPVKAKMFAKIFSTLIETDNAYRYRIEDIFSETTKEALLKNPRKEINRLLNIYLSREKGGIEFKFKLIANIVSSALLLPKIRTAFKKTTQEIDITALSLDEADRYHVLIRDGYDFLGQSFEQRWQEWVKVHNGKPPEPVEYKLT